MSHRLFAPVLRRGTCLLAAALILTTLFAQPAFAVGKAAQSTSAQNASSSSAAAPEVAESGAAAREAAASNPSKSGPTAAGNEAKGGSISFYHATSKTPAAEAVADTGRGALCPQFDIAQESFAALLAAGADEKDTAAYDFIFDGWSTEALNGGTLLAAAVNDDPLQTPVFFSGEAGTTEAVYAHYRIVPKSETAHASGARVTLTFSAGEHGSFADAQQAERTVTAGSAFPVAPLPVPEAGYEFDHWAPAPPLTAAESGSYTAVYAPEGTHFRARFAPAGAEGEAVSLPTVTEDGKEYLYFPGALFSYSGHRFAGWSTDADGAGLCYNTTTRLELTADASFYAVWLADAPTGAPVAADFYLRTDGALMQAPTAADGTPWVAVPSQGTLREARAVLNDDAAVAANLSTTPTPAELDAALKDSGAASGYRSATQEVVWNAIQKSTDGWRVEGVLRSKTAHNVFYHLNAQDDAAALFGPGELTAAQALEGDPLAPGSGVSPTRRGFRFLGWDENPAAQAPTYPAGGSEALAMPDRDVTLYAIWEARSYTVTWKNADGSVLATDTAAYYDTPAFAGEKPTRADSDSARYTFSGWGIAARPGLCPVTGDVSYTALYNAESTYPITVVLDGKAQSGTKQRCFADDAFSLPEAPERAGFIFSGWTVTDKSACAPLPAQADGTYRMPAGEVLLGGSYFPADSTSYHVVHYLESASDGSFSPAADGEEQKTGRTGSAPDLSPRAYAGYTHAPERTMYAVSGKGATPKALGIAGDSSLTVSLYYTQDTYRVSYRMVGDVPPGSAVPAAERVRTGTTFTLADPPAAVSGYKFSGWIAPPALELAKDGTFSMPDRNLAFIGIWTLAEENTAAGNSADSALEAGDLANSASKTGVSAKLDSPAASANASAMGEADAAAKSAKPSGTAESDSSAAAVKPADSTKSSSAAKATTSSGAAAARHAVRYTLDGTPFGADAPLYAVGQTLTLLPAPAQPGYTFSGWQQELSGAGEPFPTAVPGSRFAMPDADITLHGVLTEDSVTFTYALLGSAGAALSAQSETVSAVTGSPTGVTVTLPTGYHVERWQNSAGQLMQTGGATYIPTKANGLYATDTYTAFLAPDSATPYTVQYRFAALDAPDTYEALAQFPPELLSCPTAALPDEARLQKRQTSTPDGKAIAGFTYAKTTYRMADGPESETPMPAAGDGTLAVTLYYTRNTHTVTFEADGANLAPPVTLPYGTYCEELAPTGDALTETPGRQFTGWRAGGAYRDMLSPDGFYLPDADITFSAQYESTPYTVTFRQGRFGHLTYNSAATDVVTRSGLTVADRTPGEPLVTPDTGYRFTGWQADDEATAAARGTYAAGAQMPACPLSYTAQYEPDPAQTFTATLLYKLDDGTLGGRELERRPADPTHPEGFCVGTKVVFSAADAALLTQYGVKRRDADTSYEQVPFFYQNSDTANTLTFWYTADSSVIFDAGTQGSLRGAEISADGRTAVHTGLLATDAFPARPEVSPVEGYRLLGWKRTTPTGDPTLIADSARSPFPLTVPAGTTSYTAQYQAVPYALVFRPGAHSTLAGADGNGIVTHRLTIADVFPAAPAVTPAEGYRFTGWAEAETHTPCTLPNAGAAVSAKNARTYEAQCVPNVYTLTVRCLSGLDGTALLADAQHEVRHGSLVSVQAPVLADYSVLYSAEQSIFVSGDISLTFWYLPAVSGDGASSTGSTSAAQSVLQTVRTDVPKSDLPQPSAGKPISFAHVLRAATVSETPDAIPPSAAHTVPWGWYALVGVLLCVALAGGAVLYLRRKTWQK